MPDRILAPMSLLPDEKVRTAAIDAFVETIWHERDPWRQARLLALVRKQRYQAFLERRPMHAGLLEVAETLYECEKDVPESERRCYWAALELLTEPSAMPPETGPLWIEPVSGVCLVRIGPGKFRMGSDSMEADDNEKPVHEVEITQEYWLGRHPVTKGEYGRYLGPNPGPVWPQATEWEKPRYNLQGMPDFWKDSRFSTIGQPVVGVTWESAELGYCQWLRGKTGLPFHLPTEAEWEFGCRAGSSEDYFFEEKTEELSAYAWFGAGNQDPTNSSHPVGLKRPNAWGLCDTYGNVSEWCWDGYGYYRNEPERDPIVTHSNQIRAYRGGHWRSHARNCRSAFRRGSLSEITASSLGFRLALSPVRRP